MTKNGGIIELPGKVVASDPEDLPHPVTVLRPLESPGGRTCLERIPTDWVDAICLRTRKVGETNAPHGISRLSATAGCPGLDDLRRHPDPATLRSGSEFDSVVMAMPRTRR